MIAGRGGLGRPRRTAAILRSVVVAASLLLTWLTLHSSFRRSAGEAIRPAIVTEDFNDRAERAKKRAERVEGWPIGPSGLDLLPGGKGDLILSFELSPGQVALLFPWVYRPSGDISNEVWLSWDGRRWQLVGRNVHRLGTPPIPLTPPPGASRLWLRIRAEDRDPPGSPEKLIVDQIQVRTTAAVPSYAHPRTFALFIGLLAAWTIASTAPSAAGAFRRWLPAAALLCGAAAIWPWDLSAPVNLFLLDGRSVFLAAAAAAAAVLLLRRRPAWARAASPCLALLALLLAAWSRWLVWQTAATPFAPDAGLFRSVASAGGNWYATSMREPLFVWMLRGTYAAFGPSDEATRFTSMVVGIAFVGAVYLLGRRLFGAATGLVAALILAVHPALTALSVEGLRDELFALLVALFLLLLLPDRKDPGPARTAALAVVAAGIGLTRMNALAAVALLLIFFAWRRSWPWTRVAAPLAVAALFLFPYLAYCRRQYGDFFYALNIYATGFRNMEFGGQPGFPSHEAIARNLFVGPKTTTFAYIFGLHSLGETLRFIGRGYARAFFGYWAATPGFFPGSSQEVFFLYLAGLPSLLLGWKRRPAAAVERAGVMRRVVVNRRALELMFSLCVFFGPVAFLAGVSAFKLDWRIVSFVLIGYSLAVARPFALAIRLLDPSVGPRYARRREREAAGRSSR